nr:aminotransferase class I/II-fold pyridoxal phosphate-dependent enzyme [Deefgea sp. CFH1-16]
MLPLIKVGLPESNKLMPMLEQVLYSGMLAEGEPVYEFERQFSQHFGLDRAIAMSSGTAALHAALVLAGVTADDEVITTSMTAEPTNVVILQVGATPVFADVDINSGNLDPADIERKITNKTRAIVVVHYAGIPVRLAEIAEIAQRHRIPLIEDCAHALGAQYNDKGIGCIGDFAIFSFQAIKHMTTVDGGVLTFKDESLLRAAKKFRWFGLEKGIPRTEIDITSVGYKYNMHNVAATIGLAQLEGLIMLLVGIKLTVIILTSIFLIFLDCTFLNLMLQRSLAIGSIRYCLMILPMLKSDFQRLEWPLTNYIAPITITVYSNHMQQYFHSLKNTTSA